MLSSAAAAAPVLYRQAAYESPVRGGPDDLVMLAGGGLEAGSRVYYAAVRSPGAPARPPALGGAPSASAGEAPVVSAALAPQALVIRLPRTVRERATYALWVRDAHGAMSTPLLINDARPRWVSPAYLYASAERPGFARRLRVVGRNLDAAPGAEVWIRLSGPADLRLPARHSTADAREFVAEADLPPTLPVGSYAVSLTRDGARWVTVPGQRFGIRANPSADPAFHIDDPSFGGCRANDDRDDTECLLRAISAAVVAGGGRVSLPSGAWNLSARSEARRAGGIRLPPGVSLLGAGAAATTVRIAERGDASRDEPALVLLGRNRVSGIRFVDEREHSPGSYSSVVRLGLPWQLYANGAASGPMLVAGVAITGNVFSGPRTAIDAPGLPLRDLVIADNEFGAYASALELGGDRFNMLVPFQVEDAAIVRNLFKPGRLYDRQTAQGPLASELGAGLRVDFSQNVADGGATEYSGAPPPPTGWRAAFFWHMNGSHEDELISENVVSCPGDRIGDGEALAYDNGANTFAFARAATVTAADSGSVSVAEPMRLRQNDRDVPPATFYEGHWVFIADGVGVGQARRITRYATGANGATRLEVDPAWDVPPVPGLSRITVSRNYWQVLTIANVIDQRRPKCRQGNASGPRGGQISLWAQMTDSAVVANRLYETTGILRGHGYSAVDPACAECTAWTMASYFLEVSRNLIDSGYAAARGCSESGIQMAFAAAPTPGSPPPVLGYGESVARNEIHRDAAFKGGAISFSRGWYPGPAPFEWAVIDGAILQHNLIEARNDRQRSTGCRADSGRATGIDIADGGLVHDTVLYSNRCAVAKPRLRDTGRDTRALCDRSSTSACECDLR